MRFKDGQNLNSKDHVYICKGDAAESYDHFKAMSADELDNAVDELLSRDGRPSWGDCVWPTVTVRNEIVAAGPLTGCLAVGG